MKQIEQVDADVFLLDLNENLQPHQLLADKTGQPISNTLTWRLLKQGNWDILTPI